MPESERTLRAKRLQAGFSAYVLLAGPVSNGLADVAAALSSEYGMVAEWGAWADADGLGVIEATSDGVTTTIVAMPSDRPVPANHYAACADRAVGFPGARAALAGHAAHVRVWVQSSAAGLASRYAAARLVTCVAAIYARADACTAVLFPSGDVVVEPTVWRRGANAATGGGWPLTCWLSIDLLRDVAEREGGGLGVACTTVGMAAFNGHEVGFAAAPVSGAEACEHTLRVARLLLESGSELADGDSLAIEGRDERLRLRRAEVGFLGLQTDTWVILHPDCVFDEDAVFSFGRFALKPSQDDKPALLSSGLVDSLASIDSLLPFDKLPSLDRLLPRGLRDRRQRGHLARKLLIDGSKGKGGRDLE